MSFHPASIYKLAYASAITQVAIGRRLGHNDTTQYLFTGGVEPLMVPLTGDRQGCAFKLRQAGPSAFLIVDDLQFEVDPNSSFVPASIDEPLGGLLVTEFGMAITALNKSGNWPSEVIDVYFEDDGKSARGQGLERAGFKKWRAIKRVVEQVIVVAEFESTAVGER